MTERDPRKQMQRAVSAHMSADSNAKALVYAPWVLTGMLLVVLREKAASLEVEHWVGFCVAALALSSLGHAARRALARQREAAEQVIASLIRTPRGFEDLRRLQTEPRYRGIKFSDTLKQMIVSAAISQARKQEEVRDQQAHEARVEAKARAEAKAKSKPDREREAVGAR